MKKIILTGRATTDGAGVKLFRVFANDTAELTDPFLLLDNFGSDNPTDYIKGFPWHPHRGIETVTYMLDGKVEHQDSIGNKGAIKPGDVQWMTAGNGVLHQEMPKPLKGPTMSGLQLWVNLPARNKMMAPRYRGIMDEDIPIITNHGLEIRVIAGAYQNLTGPVKDLVVDTEYFDITLAQGTAFTHPVKKGYTTICYLLAGAGDFSGSNLGRRQLVLFKDASDIKIRATENLRFMLASGKPIKEPIAWGGPIVMNTPEELKLAYEELSNNTFIKQ
ncbi:MAG TPA: pirin family protein [Planctomycetota bacterium]|nr:pirin family protein [Planctomycetota bacterium]